MKKSELREMIREIVANELKTLLPECLSEMYVRRLVAESRESAGFIETVEDDEPPKVKKKIHQGIYNNKAPVSEAARNLMQGPMASLFEGVRPAPGPDENVDSNDEGIPLSRLGQNIAHLAEHSERIVNHERQADADFSPLPSRGLEPIRRETAEQSQARIEMQRKMLDSRRV